MLKLTINTTNVVFVKKDLSIIEAQKLTTFLATMVDYRTMKLS